MESGCAGRAGRDRPRAAAGGDELVCVDIFIRILLFSFIGVAWNLMGGYAKQLSLGHAAYFGLGAYTSTILQVDFGISPWIGMVAGGVVAMLASLPIGWLCFRLARALFHHRDHRDRAGADADLPQIPRSRLGRRGHHHPESRQRTADDAVRGEGRLLLCRARPARPWACHHLPDRKFLDGLLSGRDRRG